MRATAGALRIVVALGVVGALVAGCKPETGLIVEVQGPLGGGSSVEAGITKLDFVVAHPSWCERWVGVAPANHTTRDVTGRDLSKKPYDFLITPSHTTDLSEQMYVAALAYGADGTLLGEAGFDAHPLAKGEVLERTAHIFQFADTKPGGPQYVAADGACVCAPGEPWVGNGSGSGCDTRVLTSFDRLVDTAGCELTPKGSAPPVPVCDGQQFLDEPADRRLPCWNSDDQGACRVTTRGCADHNGIAYIEECNVDSGDMMLEAGTALCDRYRACQQTACTDVIGCVRSMFTQKAAVTCKLPIDPTTGPDEPIRPCSGGSWTATLPAPATTTQLCPAAMLDGVDQPPYQLGFDVAGKTGPQILSSACPSSLVIEKIDAPYPEAVPNKEFDVVSGEHLVHVTVQVVRQCVDGALSLVCSPG